MLSHRKVFSKNKMTTTTKIGDARLGVNLLSNVMKISSFLAAVRITWVIVCGNIL